MSLAEYKLTTIDNPFDPFSQPDEWYDYDEHVLCHHTRELIARIALFSDALSDEENDAEELRAINEILAYDVTGLYRRVKPGEVEKLSS